MSEKSELRRRLRQDRQEKGLCVHCGLEPPLEIKGTHTLQFTGCKKCLALKSRVQRRYAAKTTERNRLYCLKVRKDVIDKYGGICTCCGESNFAFLTIDHVNNDGSLERMPSKSWFLKLRRESRREDLQVLCWNCNMAKFHFGVCPHQSNEVVDFSPLEQDGRRKGNFGCGEKIKWPTDEKLLAMIADSNCSQVARELGVHDTAIRGRLKRRGLYNAIKVQREQEKRSGSSSV